MSSDFYSFFQAEDEEGNFYYEFLTRDQINYIVYFNVDEYSKFVDEYPLLLQHGYAFGFKRRKTSNLRILEKDLSIAFTIHKIILDFFKDRSSETVLLYHCDDSDGKHYCRNKLFQNWHDILGDGHEILRFSIEASVPINDVENRDVFLGYMIHQDNNHIDAVAEEFEAFSVALVTAK